MHVANWKPAKGSRKRQKAKAERAEAKVNTSVYDYVTERDGGVCRVCGSGGFVHRHHLRGRQYTTREDVCLLCAVCHGDTHVRVGGKRLDIRGNADRVEGLIVRMRFGKEWKVMGRV